MLSHSLDKVTCPRCMDQFVFCAPAPQRWHRSPFRVRESCGEIVSATLVFEVCSYMANYSFQWEKRRDIDMLGLLLKSLVKLCLASCIAEARRNQRRLHERQIISHEAVNTALHCRRPQNAWETNPAAFSLSQVLVAPVKASPPDPPNSIEPLYPAFVAKVSKTLCMFLDWSASARKRDASARKQGGLLTAQRKSLATSSKWTKAGRPNFANATCRLRLRSLNNWIEEGFPDSAGSYTEDGQMMGITSYSATASALDSECAKLLAARFPLQRSEEERIESM